MSSLATTMPAFFRPRNATNMPIPAPTASFICMGMASMIFSRTFVTASTKKITPDRKVPDSASCHGIPIPSTTE